MPLILGAQSAVGGFSIDNCCRFDNGDSPYFASDFAGTGSASAAIATYSFWVKLGLEDTRATLISGKDDTSNYLKIRFADDGSGHYFAVYGVSPSCDLRSTAVFRDPLAWYNVVMAFDTAQAVDTNRIKVWINGEQITSWSTSTFIAQNEELFLTKSDDLEIGAYNNTEHFDGYMAEVVCIDGTALDETSFGEFDSDSPTIWKPKDVSGLSVGTKGYHLDFKNSAALGDDVSGNNNDFTETNIVAADQGTDSPTNNFCTMNPLINRSLLTYSEGNNQIIGYGDGYSRAGYGTMALSAGKWYYEFKVNSTVPGNTIMGIANVNGVVAQSSLRFNPFGSGTGYSYGYKHVSGDKVTSGTESSYGNTWGQNDIMSCAIDLDNLKIYFGKNDTWQDSGDPTSGASGTGAAFTIQSGEDYLPAQQFDNGPTIEFNFGGCSAFTVSSANQDGNGYGNFEYAVPSGYLAICTKNLGSDGG